jgi:hypothetical protein
VGALGFRNVICDGVLSSEASVKERLWPGNPTPPVL